MKILCCCLRAKFLTGSEVYFYELCSALTLLSHSVTLAATEVSDHFIKYCSGYNFKIINLDNLNEKDFDLIILSHAQETYKKIQFLMPNTKIINICHSEIYESELPLISDQVIKYVGIRQPICDKMYSCGIDREKIELIRNPINLNRFNTQNITDEKFGLFVGTMGGLRYKSALHFASFCKANNLQSIYISAENQELPFFDLNLRMVENVEQYFKKCSISGGIIHGRTYFEARLCGKPTIEYFINNMGAITNIDYEDAPDDKELKYLQNQFDKTEVAKKIIAV